MPSFMASTTGPVKSVELMTAAAMPFALAAIALNAAENGVEVDVLAEDLIGADRGWEVVLAGDVAYEREMATAVFAWVEALARRGADILIGDPRRAYLPLDRLERLAEYSVPTTRALEDADVKRTGVFRFRGTGTNPHAFSR